MREDRVDEIKKFDCIIPIKQLDTQLLPIVIENIKRYICPQNIILITNAKNSLPKSLMEDVILLDEDRIIPNLTLRVLQDSLQDKGANPARAGWYFQQFLKMFYAKMDYSIFQSAILGAERAEEKFDAKHTYYLIWDADSIPLRSLEFFTDKILFETSSEYHKPYFETLQRLAIPILLPNGEIKQLQKIIQPSFITEHMMVECSKMRELIEQIEKTHQKPFWQAIMDCIHPSDLDYSGFSEFETYGNFVAMKDLDNLKLIRRRRDRGAKTIIGSNPSQEQILWYGRSYDVCGIESWDKETWISSCTKNRISRLISPRIWRVIYKIYKKIIHIFQYR